MMDPLEHLQMLKDSAAGIAPRKGDLKRIRALRFTEPGFDRDTWREMCEMGWLGLRVSKTPVARVSAQEFCGLAEELGAGLVPEPLIAAAMAAQLLPPDHLAPVLSGERVVLRGVAGEAEQHRSDRRYGSARWQAERAQAIHPDGSAVPMHSWSLCRMDCAGGARCARRVAGNAETQDGGNFGTLILDNAPAEAIDGDAIEALEHCIMASSAYLHRTDGPGLRDHARPHEDARAVRPQDRRLPGTAASRGRYADPGFADPRDDRFRVHALDDAPTLGQRQAAVSRAKVRASDAAMVVTRACIQLHGGVGYTDAYDIGALPRKAMVLSPLYGSPSVHRASASAPWRRRCTMSDG